MILIPLGALVIASYYDLKYRRVPNWLTFSVVILSFYKIDQFLIFVLLLALLLLSLFRGSIGGGDIKLGVAVGLWAHILLIPQSWLLIALILGGLYAIIFRKRSIPFAPFMAMGFLITYLAI